MTQSTDKVLIIRSCKPDMTSHNGFVWPQSGPVECSDWRPTKECGNGLHGLLWGQGDWSLCSSDPFDTWLVVEVLRDAVIALGGKVKFPRGNVIHCGTLATALIYLSTHELFRKTQCGSNVASGNSSKAASSGDSSTAASSGDYSTAASSGYYSTAASSGDYSTAASSGDYSKAASSGDYSKAASSGYSSKAVQAGKCGIAAAIGDAGMAKAGETGAIVACYWDGSRYRVCVGYVGEDGIKADTWYKADPATGKLTEVAR
jgi:hypothetical protein